MRIIPYLAVAAGIMLFVDFALVTFFAAHGLR
jgi:hypothetical protein